MLNYSENSNPRIRKVSAVKVRTLVKNGILELGMEMCGRTLLNLRSLNPEVLKGFISAEETVSPSSADEILPLLPLTEGTNLSSSTKTVVSLSEENVSQDNTHVPQGPPIVARLKTKQAPRGEIESSP